MRGEGVLFSLSHFVFSLSTEKSSSDHPVIIG